MSESANPAEGMMAEDELEPVTGVDEVIHMGLDLTKDEKLRTTALMMAIKYYTDTIVKDGALYNAMKIDGKHLTPASVNGCVYVAMQFEDYLAGRTQQRLEHAAQTSGQNTEDAGRQEPDGEPE